MTPSIMKIGLAFQIIKIVELAVAWKAMDESRAKLDFIFVFGVFDSYGNDTNIMKIAQYLI